MASVAPETPPLSPDGRSWWDGQTWQPLFTPDGMSRWNGREWVRLPVPYGVVVAAPARSAPAAPPPPPVQVPLEPLAPSWDATPQGAPPVEYIPPPRYTPVAGSGPKPIIYLGGLLVVAILAAAGWTLHDQLAGGQTLPLPTPSGSEYTRAKHFLNDQLAPQLTEVTKTLPALQTNCTPALPASCQDAIAATDDKMRAVTTTIQRADIPPCIAVPVTQFKADWGKMQAGLEEALGGYQGHNNAFINDGLFNASTNAKKVQPDAAAIDAAGQACPK